MKYNAVWKWILKKKPKKCSLISLVLKILKLSLFKWTCGHQHSTKEIKNQENPVANRIDTLMFICTLKMQYISFYVL